MPTLNGWILDTYPSPEGMTVWLIDTESESHFLVDSFMPSFFVHGPTGDLHALCEFLRARRLPVTLRRTERRDLFARREIELLEIAAPDPTRFTHIVQRIREWKPHLAYYNCTVPVAQLYFYERQLFPLARVEIETDAHNHICAIERRDSPWAIDYELPELKIMTLRLEGEAGNPNHDARPRPLAVDVEGTTRVLLDDDPRDLLIRVRELFEQYDPDLLITSYGDSHILPRLLEMSQRYGVTLPFNRDAQRAVQFRRPHSYFSYGRIMFRSASHTFFGRLHLDLDNTFLFDDYSFDGLFEMARLAQMPIQRVARTSTGTCLSSMEMSTAYRQNIVIPAEKREPEEFHSADGLIVADKGGLVYQPILGLHERVAELDFSSMFPSIMDRFNLSGETLNCECCPQAPRVPELGLRICQKQRGLIPATIAPVITKRAQLKAKVKILPPGPARERYQRLVSCLKWIGVVSFGYAGYRNAVFGNITAHQAICAFARDKLLVAKELAEQRGFRLLHAIVDALYIQEEHPRWSGADTGEEEYAGLVHAIFEATGLRIELEGVYNWIVFAPSKQDEQMSVANRYFGVFQNSDLKIRGIELRRHDTPPFIRRAQNEMLGILALAQDRAGYRERADQVMDLACDYIDRLRAGQIPFDELVITQRLSHDPRAYSKNTLNALAARELVGSGVELEPGESIQYVILDAHARAPGDRVRAFEHLDGSLAYDAEKYQELFIKSLATLLAPLGFTPPLLAKYLAAARALPKARRQPLPRRPAELPLFAWAKKEGSPTLQSTSPNLIPAISERTALTSRT